MVPILTIWGLTQKRAQGTSLVVIITLIPVAIITYAMHGNIDFHFAIPLAIGGVIGGVTGSNLALRFSNRLLARLFGAFLIIIALRLIFMHTPSDICEVASLRTWWDYTETGLFGMLAGLTAGFFGVGGGVVFVPTGVIFAGLQQCIAQGSSLTAILPTTLVATLNYQREHEIEWSLVKWMAPGAIIGAVAGAVGADVLAHIRNGRILTILFSLFLLFTGIRRLIRSYNAAKASIGKTS
jgi:sulfite exporter TauE/SafE